MSTAGIILLALVFGLVVFDMLSLSGKNRRALLLEVLVFLTGAYFIVFPEHSTTLAHLFGIGRGVDFLLYPIIIWLTRETLLSRRQHVQDAESITLLTRALALTGVREQHLPLSQSGDSHHTETSIPPI